MIFAAEHGSWNRASRTGYKVIMVPVVNGKATGEYQDFLTGFVTSEDAVWGRPVGVTVARDGSLMVTDDGSNSACGASATSASRGRTRRQGQRATGAASHRGGLARLSVACHSFIEEVRLCGCRRCREGSVW